VICSTIPGPPHISLFTRTRPVNVVHFINMEQMLCIAIYWVLYFLRENLLRMQLMHLHLLLAKVAAPFPYSHDISMIGREHWLMPCRRSTSIRNRHLDRRP
jgi:hypothetical protein